MPSEVIPLLCVCLFLGAVEAIPYYFAIRNIDISIAISLYVIADVLTPFLAFFFLGESFSFFAGVGFVLVLGSLLVLAFDPKQKFKLNIAFWLIALSAIVSVCDAALEKEVLKSVDWLTLTFLWYASQPLIIFPLLFIPKLRKQIKEDAKTFKQTFKILLTQEFLYSFGLIAYVYALEKITFIESQVISDSQPIFVVLLTLFLGLFWRFKIREHTDMKSILKKGIFFSLIILGVSMVIQGTR